MGRPEYNQRADLPANRELRRALSAHRPKSFGIRRLLEDQDNIGLTAVWDGLQSAKDIPDTLEPRLEKGVTLLPKRVLGAQLTRGLVIGHRLGQAHTEFERDQQLNTIREPLVVELGRTAILRRKTVYVPVISEELEIERERLFHILEKAGFKGAHKSLSKPLHITLGEASKPISLTEERHVRHSIDDTLGDNQFVQLQEWETYPSVDQLDGINPDDF
jgi:hypothetical protein